MSSIEKVDSNRYLLVELKNLEDNLLPAWLDLYERSFPPEERVLISHLIKVLKDENQSREVLYSMLALVTPEELLLGISMCELIPHLSVAYMWYMAIAKNLQNQGIGSVFYHRLIDRLFEENNIVIFEVEIPEKARSEEDQRLARRRIKFYQRNGAMLLGGITYFQEVGDHFPPTQMQIMVHLRSFMTPAEVFTKAKAIFNDAIFQSGSLSLI